MSHISESIPDLLGGVSQLAPQRREVNEVESMVNCQLRPAEGVVKRPPTKWIAEIASSATAYDGAFVHTINKNANERFWVIVLDGDLKVFNAVDGVEVPVSFPDGKSYLDVVASPNEAFRLATFNQTTVIVNRETTVARASELSAERGEEALVVVQQTDYDVTYKVGISFDGPFRFGFEEDESVILSAQRSGAAARIPHPQDDEDPPTLSTVAMANLLASRIKSTYGPEFAGFELINVSTYGSTIRITPGPDLQDGAKFWVATQDDLSNQGLQKVQHAVQGIDDLPEEGPVGFRIKVEGDPEKALDDVYYEFTEFNTWKETNQSGIPIALDPATLPLELVHNPDLLASKYPSQVPTATFFAGGKTNYTAPWLETEDGTPSTQEQLVISPAPGVTVDKFLNIADANGEAIDMVMEFVLDQRGIYGPGPDPADPTTYLDGDDVFIEVASDAAGGGYNTAYIFKVPPNYLTRKFEIKLNFGGATFDAGDNVRLRVISAAGNRGSLILTANGTTSTSYAQTELQRISLPTTHYAPGTDMAFTLNGTAFSLDFVAGGTRDEYAAALVIAIEAYGGVAVTATYYAGSDHLTVANDDGSTPTFTAFVFDDNLDSTIQYFNGGADFVNLGVTIGDTIKNKTDVSEAIISGVATTIITHAILAGGTANAWADEDQGSAETSALSFACRQPTWVKREVGTEETNKWPSFEDETINEVSFLKNRLVLISDENVAMSVVDKFYTFFRTSTIDVLDSDRIDVALSGPKTSQLHSAFTWNQELLVWSELGQFVVNGEPFLSPNTVRRESTTSYVNTRKVKPVASERAVYFLTEGNEFCQLWDYKPTSEDATSAEGNRLSVQVPRYMPGVPRALLAVSDPEVVLVLTATDPEKLYVFSHLIQDQQRIMGGWHEWDFAGVTQILGMGSIDNEVSLVLERDDGKVHLEVLDMWELSESTVDAQEDSDEMPTPPTYDPVGGSLLIIEDTFQIAGYEDLDTVYTPAPTPYGGTNWEVGTDGGTPYGVQSNIVRDDGTGIASPARLNVNVADDNLEIGGEFYQSSLLTAAQSGSLLLCVDEVSQATSLMGGIFITVDWDSVNIRLVGDDGFDDRISSDWAHGVNMVTTGLQIFLKKVGTTLSAYKADAGTGANKTLLGTMTLTGPEQAHYEDGAHRRVGFQCTGTQAGHYTLDNLKVWDVAVVLGAGTSYTPGAARAGMVAVEADGTETTLTLQGDGTLLLPDRDLTLAPVDVGIPVASTIELTRLFHRKNFGPYAGKAEVRGNTYINNLLVGLEDTSTMAIAIAITGHASFSQDLTELRSLDGEYMYCRVGGRNTETTITFTSSDASNFKIVGIDWEGVYHNRTGRMS